MCGSSFAIVCANKSPDPGVALNPPVPQPQLKYKPLIEVLLKIGLASGQISTIHPHCLNILILLKIGYNSKIAFNVPSTIW